MCPSWQARVARTWRQRFDLAATWDSSIALIFAFFINASILILAAAAFHFAGRTDVAEIQDAYKLLSPMLGAGAASILFAVALLASGQNSTLTGTLTGQIEIRVVGQVDDSSQCRRRGILYVQCRSVERVIYLDIQMTGKT